jgi:hypothetical protein
MLPALLTSYLLNIGVSRWDWSPWLSYVPYMMGLITSLIFMAVVFQPDVLLLVGVANWVQGKNLLPADPAFKPWQDFTNAVWLTVAWINIPFMYIGGVPAGANPFAVIAILSTITIISLISKKTIWRKVVMWSAVVILSVNLLTLISQPMWFWLTGDTMHFGATKTDVALANVRDTMKQAEDEITQIRLNKIANDIKGGRIISEADTAFLIEQQNKIATLPKKLSGIKNELLEKVDSLKKTVPPVEKPAEPPKKPTAKKTPTAIAQAVVTPTQTVQAPPPAARPVQNLEVKYVAKNGTPQYFKVHSMSKTMNSIEINCAFQMKFIGSSVGNNIYGGVWSQPGVNGAEFEISFSDDSHASGDIHTKEGWNELDLYPI